MTATRELFFAYRRGFIDGASYEGSGEFLYGKRADLLAEYERGKADWRQGDYASYHLVMQAAQLRIDSATAPPINLTETLRQVVHQSVLEQVNRDAAAAAWAMQARAAEGPRAPADVFTLKTIRSAVQTLRENNVPTPYGFLWGTPGLNATPPEMVQALVEAEAAGEPIESACLRIGVPLPHDAPCRNCGACRRCGAGPAEMAITSCGDPPYAVVGP